MSEAVARGRGLSPRRLLLQELRLVYANALEEHLVDGTEASRRQACDIGRWAIAQGIGVLKTAIIHHECLGRILVRLSGSLPFKEGLRRAAEFLAEVLSQYELAHRRSREAVPALRALNEKMEREIQRIALAVHDEAGQLLYAARLAISAAADAASPTVRQRLAEVEAILNRAEQELRQLSHDLRPTILDDLGWCRRSSSSPNASRRAPGSGSISSARSTAGSERTSRPVCTGSCRRRWPTWPGIPARTT